MATHRKRVQFLCLHFYECHCPTAKGVRTIPRPCPACEAAIPRQPVAVGPEKE